MTPRRRLTGDQGSSVVEVAVMAPVVLLLIGFLTLCGRVTNVRQNLQTAAADAARAASFHASVVGAEGAAAETVASSLVDAGVSCVDLRVEVDSEDLSPGGSVEVTVDCAVSLSGLSGMPLPGDKRMAVSVRHVIDRYGVQEP